MSIEFPLLRAEIIPKIKPIKRLPMGISPKVSILKILLDNVSEEYGVAQKLIANKSDLQELVLDDQADIKTLKGWRYKIFGKKAICLLYTSPSPRDATLSRMPSSA